jgi:transcription-repair coupling factor (superfamily II helicase)
LAERVTEMLAEYSTTAELLPLMSAKARDSGSLASNRIVTVGKLANGFALPAAALSVLTESDVFGDIERATQRAIPKKARKKRTAAAFLSDLGDLKVGDYVVHIDHGIGQFQGLDQIVTAGGPTGNVAAGLERGRGDTREFMLLTYAEGARFCSRRTPDLVKNWQAKEPPNSTKTGRTRLAKAKA